jgi:hypothetical protein
MRKYYRLLNELNAPNDRWFLGKVNFDGEWDFWKYLSAGGAEVAHKDLSVSVREWGRKLDFTFADFDLPIVNEKVAELMPQDDVQFLPVEIEGHVFFQKYFIMLIKNELDCVDETKSVFDRWEENNLIRPDKAGKYKTFYKLYVQSDKIGKQGIFRIKDYNTIIIMNDELKKKFDKLNISGVKFKEVS